MSARAHGAWDVAPAPAPAASAKQRETWTSQQILGGDCGDRPGALDLM